MAFGTQLTTAVMAEVQKFQSLFFWNGLWDTSRSARPCGYDRVSILVFLEWPLGRRTASPVGRAPEVSILVFLEWPLGRRGCAYRLSRPDVSILVFLEWPLGLDSDKGKPQGQGGFNPCFSGMAFGTQNEEKREA